MIPEVCTGGPLRKATRADLDRCFEIRESARENRLDDPYEIFIEIGGQFIDDGLAWVWEQAGEVQGFAAYIPETGTIEVLYIYHLAQDQGIGTALLRQCCDDLRELGLHEAILSTTPGTDAEIFYRNRGWTEFGVNEVGDLLFKLPLG